MQEEDEEVEVMSSDEEVMPSGKKRKLETELEVSDSGAASRYQTAE